MSAGIGWKGFCKVEGAALPFTSGNISETQEIYYPALIGGGGVGTPVGSWHSENNAGLSRKLISGRLAGYAFGGGGTAETAFRNLLITAIGRFPSDNSKRYKGFSNTSPLVLNAGHSRTLSLPGLGLHARAVVSKFSLEGEEAGLVKFETEILSTSAEEGPSSASVGDYTYELGGFPDDQTPVAFGSCVVGLTGSGEPDMSKRITAWSLEVSNSPQPVYTFSGQTTPTMIHQGLMVVRGSFRYYVPDSSSFVPILTDGAVLTVQIGNVGLRCDFVVFEGTPVDAGSANTPTERMVRFGCLSAGNNPGLYISS